VVEGGEVAAETVLEEGDAAWFHTMQLPATENTFFRVEVRGPAGEERAFSNPIHFLRSVAAKGLEPARAALDVGGVRSLKIEGLRLGDARLEAGALAIAMAAGSGPGRLLLDLEEFGVPAEVRLEGLEGQQTLEGTRLTLEALQGEGRVVLIH
jgi:hypothetical protein